MKAEQPRQAGLFFILFRFWENYGKIEQTTIPQGKKGKP